MGKREKENLDQTLKSPGDGSHSDLTIDSGAASSLQHLLASPFASPTTSEGEKEERPPWLDIVDSSSSKPSGATGQISAEVKHTASVKATGMGTDQTLFKSKWKGADLMIQDPTKALQFKNITSPSGNGESEEQECRL